MVLRSLILVSICCVSILRLAGAAPATPAIAASASDKMSGLLSNSPFGNGKTGVSAASAGGEAFEFRSVLEEGGSKFFSIYEVSSRKSNWVELNDPVNGFSVKAYDAAKESVTLDYQGRSMTLTIKRAPAVAQAMQPPPVMPSTNNGGMPVINNNNNPTSPGVPTAMDQQRIQQIQEEIRRRRALRSQSAGPSNLNTPGASPNTNNGQISMPLPQPQPSSATGSQPSPSSGPQMIPPRT